MSNLTSAHSHTRLDHRRLPLALLAIIALPLLFMIGSRIPGIDYQPLVWALHLELTGDSAYGPEMYRIFDAAFGPPYDIAGFAYPLPAIWLAAPVAAFPESVARGLWFMLSFGSLALGVALLRMPWPLLLFSPLITSMSVLQVSGLLVGMLLIGIWAARERRYNLVAVIVALTLASKPQATVMIAGALAIMSLRAGRWRPLLIASLVVVGLTLPLDPLWPLKWIDAAKRYSQSIPTMWLIAWVPAGLYLLYRGRTWAGLAVLQIAIAPLVLCYYVILPLMLAYVDVRSQRMGWVAAICSWLSFPLALLGPPWITLAIFFLLPLLAANLMRGSGSPPAQALPA